MRLAAAALAAVLASAATAVPAVIGEGDSLAPGPPIPVTDLSGNAVDLRATLAPPAAAAAQGAQPAPADGRAPGATLLVFWGTWCQPCIHEAPEIRAIGRYYAARGLRVLSVAMNAKEDSPGKVADVARSTGIDYPVYFDAQDAARKAFGIESLPSSLLVDGRGVVRWKGTLLPTDINARIQAVLESGHESGSR